MPLNIDFYFDFVSPTAFLAYKRLQQLQQSYDLSIQYHPIFLGGLLKAIDSVSPITIPAKLRYSMQHDLPRFAKRYGVALKPNPHFPFNSIPLLRGAIAAAQMEQLVPYCEVVFDGIWQQQLDLSQPQELAKVLADAGIDAEKLLMMVQEPAIKETLAENAREAQQRGAFGVPTLYIGDDMYFGQDRMDFIEQALQAQ